ncbi:MAG: hypothetical protein IPN42_10335 [Methylococcaceae bacterium]|nr:hypothetical protein [Methylococcaceae bacterium]
MTAAYHLLNHCVQPCHAAPIPAIRTPPPLGQFTNKPSTVTLNARTELPPPYKKSAEIDHANCPLIFLTQAKNLPSSIRTFRPIRKIAPDSLRPFLS